MSTLYPNFTTDSQPLQDGLTNPYVGQPLLRKVDTTWLISAEDIDVDFALPHERPGDWNDSAWWVHVLDSGAVAQFYKGLSAYQHSLKLVDDGQYVRAELYVHNTSRTYVTGTQQWWVKCVSGPCDAAVVPEPSYVGVMLMVGLVLVVGKWLHKWRVS